MGDEYNFGGFAISLWLVAGIIGYFIYGGLAGALAIVLLSILAGVLSLAGFIPVIGPLAYWLIATRWLFPWVFTLTHIVPTTLTSAILVIYLLLSILYTLVTTFIGLVWLGNN